MSITRRWTEEDLARAQFRAQCRVERAEQGATTEPKPKPSKYHSRRTVVDDPRFGPVTVDSRLEAKLYERLLGLMATGQIRSFLPQVPIRLAGGARLIVDFLVDTWPRDPALRWLDTKGVDLPMGRLKRKQVSALYPYEIELVRGGEADRWEPGPMPENITRA